MTAVVAGVECRVTESLAKFIRAGSVTQSRCASQGEPDIRFAFGIDESIVGVTILTPDALDAVDWQARPERAWLPQDLRAAVDAHFGVTP